MHDEQVPPGATRAAPRGTRARTRLRSGSDSAMHPAVGVPSGRAR